MAQTSFVRQHLNHSEHKQPHQERACLRPSNCRIQTYLENMHTFVNGGQVEEEYG